MSNVINTPEILDEAAFTLFRAHNPNSSPDNEMNKRIISGFRTDMEILALYFNITKKENNGKRKD